MKLIAKYFIIIFVFTILLLQPYSYSEITQSEWDTVYNLVEDCVRQGKWEEAQVSLWYLKDLIVPHDGQYRSQDLDQLDFRVSTLFNQNLESLYQEGQNQLNNSEFSKALMTFRKILYYNSVYKSTRYLSWKTQNLNNSAKGIQQKTIIVTSKTPDKKQTGLRVYKPEKCFNGYTLFAHQPLGENISLNYIYLIDMKGNIIWKWLTTETGVVFARLKSNGNIFFNNHSKLQELDFQSNVIWDYTGSINHDFQILEDGNFLIERDEYIDGNPKWENDYDIPNMCSRIEIITPDKEVLWQWKAEEHIEELEKLIGIKILTLGDWANNNTCEILKDNLSGKKDARFKKGNIILSADGLCTIGIINYPTGEIVWTWGPGILSGQHTPTMLDNGNILIFDNGGRGRDWSRVIELNPLTEQIVWEYHAEPKKDFFGFCMSSATRLPNGNTLICEATSNRFFEITPNGEIIWDFISTFHKTTGTGVGIYRAYRYSPEYVQPLLDKINQWQNQQKSKFDNKNIKMYDVLNEN